LFVRELEQGEMEFLAQLRKSRRQALRQRAQILMASMVYTPVYQIALICKTDEAYVRKVIHAFNDFGFESLNPKVGTGRPKTFEPATRERTLRTLGNTLQRIKGVADDVHSLAIAQGSEEGAQGRRLSLRCRVNNACVFNHMPDSNDGSVVDRMALLRVQRRHRRSTLVQHVRHFDRVRRELAERRRQHHRGRSGCRSCRHGHANLHRQRDRRGHWDCAAAHRDQPRSLIDLRG
jgi:hypothetical protein